jgi:polyphosphate kinase 2 (PPK2 family)
LNNPTKRWKFSEVDLKSYRLWDDYSRAKDEMFGHTDTKQSPWYVVNADDKKRARLNCISHLLSMIPYDYIPHDDIEFPERQNRTGYVRTPITEQTFVPEIY